MRILLDGMNLALEQGTGVATYARGVAAGLRARGRHVTLLYGKPSPAKGDPVLREAMFVDAPAERFPLSRKARIAVHAFGLPIRAAPVPRTGLVERRPRARLIPDCDTLLNAADLFTIAQTRFDLTGRFLEVTVPDPVDVAHWTYPIPIRLRGAKNVYTVHDVVPLKLPYATLDRKPRHHRLLRAITRHADHVVTVSEASRADILAMTGAAPERVTNTHQSVAIPAALLSADDAQVDAALRNGFHAPAATEPGAPGAVGPLTREGFYLYVGAIEPKKNLERVIEAYAASDAPEPLVVVGRRGWAWEGAVKAMARTRGVVYLDYLPFSQVVTLMRTARAVVFASLYEGFGLPVLEAFVCGAPVVTASVGATAEIAEDAALLVDPYDVAAIRDAFRALSAPDSGPLRRDLAAKGRARAAAFGEDRVGAALEACYARVLAG